MDQRAAIWQYQASAREARADMDLEMREQSNELQRLDENASEQQHSKQFAAGVSAQQTAWDKLMPLMRACVNITALRLASLSTENANLIVSASLKLCRPAIIAAARTVELAHLSSDGLADDMAAKLRSEVKRIVIVRQKQGQGGGSGSFETMPR